MDIAEFADEAVGAPFAAHGRTREGWDCWGLFRAAYAAVYGVELPSFDGTYASVADRRELAAALGAFLPRQWVQVDEAEARAGDGVVLTIGRLPCHVALVVDPRRRLMLHAEERVNTVAERWDRAPWSTRVEGFYRYAPA